MNRIAPFKGRRIDFSKPVWVYRNLNKKGVVYSIRQNGLVVGHARLLYLEDGQFIVNEKGRARVVKEQRKNVHAFIKGRVVEEKRRFINRRYQIRYNPYLLTGFFYTDYKGRNNTIDYATDICLTESGVWASFVRRVA